MFLSRRLLSSFAPSVKLGYKPLPKKNDFVVNTRRGREVLVESWNGKNAPTPVRIELMDENDTEFMIQYVTEHFVKESNLVRHLNIKGEDFIELIAPLVTEWIQSKNSIICQVEDKTVGAYFGNIHTRDEFPQLYNNELFHDNPKFVIKNDYAEDIRNGPFRDHGTNAVVTLLEELVVQTGKFLPKDCQSYGIHELYATHPAFNGCGLGTQACFLMRDLMFKQGVTHEGGYCIAVGTRVLGNKNDLKDAFCMPYDKFLENGKPVWENLHDGAKEAWVVIGESKAWQDKLAAKQMNKKRI